MQKKLSPGEIEEIRQTMIEAQSAKKGSEDGSVDALRRLRSFGDYWQAFGFVTEAEYLSYYGLHDLLPKASPRSKTVTDTRATTKHETRRAPRNLESRHASKNMSEEDDTNS